MHTRREQSLHLTLFVLMIATCGTFVLRADGIIEFTFGAITLAIAYSKGRLVILDYMELRHAPVI